MSKKCCDRCKEVVGENFREIKINGNHVHLCRDCYAKLCKMNTDFLQYPPEDFMNPPEDTQEFGFKGMTPMHKRECIVTLINDGYTHEQIARLLHISNKTVFNYIHKDFSRTSAVMSETKLLDNDTVASMSSKLIKLDILVNVYHNDIHQAYKSMKVNTRIYYWYKEIQKVLEENTKIDFQRAIKFSDSIIKDYKKTGITCEYISAKYRMSMDLTRAAIVTFCDCSDWDASLISGMSEPTLVVLLYMLGNDITNIADITGISSIAIYNRLALCLSKESWKEDLHKTFDTHIPDDILVAEVAMKYKQGYSIEGIKDKLRLSKETVEDVLFNKLGVSMC